MLKAVVQAARAPPDVASPRASDAASPRASMNLLSPAFRRNHQESTPRLAYAHALAIGPEDRRLGGRAGIEDASVKSPARRQNALFLADDGLFGGEDPLPGTLEAVREARRRLACGLPPLVSSPRFRQPTPPCLSRKVHCPFGGSPMTAQSNTQQLSTIVPSVAPSSGELPSILSMRRRPKKVDPLVAAPCGRNAAVWRRRFCRVD
mmetsp:Transcript_52353/g.168697  ORF Transcript_52353/g.168697 Transcript_52353/m.168697 type:complete len:206 (-) Transcript_52353:393-1010(-)